MSPTSPVKLLAIVRRKPGLTRQEFFDYHFQIHGSISESPDGPEYTPWKYYQTHFIDGVFPARTDPAGPPNSNYHFSFVDDMTELYFKDPSHMKTVMTSNHVQTVVGPDGLNFNDFAASNAIIAMPEHTVFGEAKDGDAAFTAEYFVVAKDKPEDGSTAAKALSSELVKAIETVGRDEVYRLDVTTKLPDPAGIVKYFGAGGPEKPAYTVVFKLFMASMASVTTVRKVQKAFEDIVDGQIEREWSMTLFGKRGLVLDQERGIKFDGSRQPRLYS